MSIRYSGDARRSFIIGSSEWPPAITRAPAWLVSDAIAPSRLVARSYSNGPGVCTGRPFVRLGCGAGERAAHAGRVTRLVLHGSVGPDHGRAQRSRFARLGIELARRQAGVGDVTDRRAIRALGRDRRLAPQARKRERALRVDLGDAWRLDVT